MHKTIMIFLLMLFPVLAQEKVFGYEIIDEPLEPAVISYIEREVWAYGNLRLYCQNPINTEQVYRFYDTTPERKLIIHKIVRVKLDEPDWLRLIHVNGGLTSLVDHSGVASKTALLLTLTTDTSLTNPSLFFYGDLRSDEFYIPCQNFFTFIFPKSSYLERVFSFQSFQDIAQEKDWSKKIITNILDVYAPVQVGMTKDMVLWKLGAPLRPLELDEALDASHWYYLSSIPSSKDVTFGKEDGKVIKFVEGRLP